MCALFSLSQDEEVYQLFCGINNRESGVEAIRIIRDSNVGLGKGIAYVLFKTKVYAFSILIEPCTYKLFLKTMLYLEFRYVISFFLGCDALSWE